MKIKSVTHLFLIAVLAIAFIACGEDSADQTTKPGDTTPAVKPPAADVRNMYDTVNNEVNAKCSSDVNTGNTATYSYSSGTLRVVVSATPTTVFPMTVVYVLSNFASSPYTVNGTIRAVVTAQNYWKNAGALTATGGDVSSLKVDMERNGDPNVMTGTLVVNGYQFTYETSSYK